MLHTDLCESKPRNYPVGSFRMSHDPISRSVVVCLIFVGRDLEETLSLGDIYVKS